MSASHDFKGFFHKLTCIHVWWVCYYICVNVLFATLQKINPANPIPAIYQVASIHMMSVRL